ncbi:MAG: mechanosensitive ion channel [Cryomorphaceae bacterium]|nr:mechanosensitive ion channel [Cryomorphaceae bacterium]
MVESFDHWAHNWISGMGMGEEVSQFLVLMIDLSLLTIATFIGAWISKRIFLRIIKAIIVRSRNKYDDVLLEMRVFDQLAYIVPAIVVKYIAPKIFNYFPTMYLVVDKVTSLFIIVVFMMAIHRLLKSVGVIAGQIPTFEGKPVKSFVQVFSIINVIFGTVFIISFVVGKNPIAILSAFGALTAVLMLVFKDTILGLVASIQLSANDMVRVGDWVSMDKYGADGDVLEINLTTIKVRNWDKTITTVPTYAVIADSFKNWRGMQAMGARRIKRSVMIDVNTVKFVDEELLKQLKDVFLLQGFIDKRKSEIEAHNAKYDFNRSVLINGRNMTNLGVFRQYVLSYLQNHPKVHQGETVMVRQLQPTEHGIPLEIYCFSNDIAWVNYENIQSDIFDHIFAAIKHFDLRVFQVPSGLDFRTVLKK